MSLLMIPGEKTDIVQLNEVLRVRHEERRAARARELAERKSTNSPLDDGIDWAKVDTGKIIAAVARRDSADLRAAAAELSDATAELLEQLPAYVDDPRLEKVDVQCVVLSEAKRRELARNEQRELHALRDAIKRMHEADTHDAQEALFLGRRAYVAAAVSLVQVEGHEDFAVMDERTLDILERSSLILPLFAAAVAAQDLSPGEAMRSGSSPASTSSATTAPAALTIDAPASDATGAATSPMRARAGQPTPAPGGTC